MPENLMPENLMPENSMPENSRRTVPQKPVQCVVGSHSACLQQSEGVIEKSIEKTLNGL